MSATQKPPRVLVIAAFDATYIRADIDFLRSRYAVTVLIGSGPAQVGRILSTLPSSDVVVSWFASTYGAVGTLGGWLLRKRTIIQLGGVDMARDARTGYGLWLSPWRSALVARALRRADRVLAVDPTLVEEARLRASYRGDNLEVLPTGFNPASWTPYGTKESRILCVAGVPDEARVRIKGIDTLTAAARANPDLRITVVGVDPVLVPSLDPPANVEFVPWLSRDALLAQYRRARVYCQPSRREGLPNALCEAMLCECIPVATSVGGNPRGVGNAGFLVLPDDPQALARGLREALAAPDELGRLAREHVVAAFPLQRRHDRLASLIEGPTA